jgi:hypothetical protein
MCTLATTVLTIFIVFSFLQAAARAFRCELKTGMTKCFSEEIAKDALAVGKYTIPAGGDVVDAGISIKVSGPTPLSVGASKTHFKKKRAQVGKFAFTAEETGSHHACFSNHGQVTTRIAFDLKVGVAAKDYSEVAKKEHLEPLQVELKRLEDSAREIHEEQLFMRQREEEMRDTNESTNNRLKWFSTSTIIILSVLGGWQIVYLRSYFQAKKLPGNWH